MGQDTLDSGVTAVLSILKESDSSERSRKQCQYHYSILLWFIGRKILLPPYLPRVRAYVGAGERDALLDDLERLTVRYQKHYSDHELSPRESDEILDHIQRVGRNIAKYPLQLEKCLKFLCTSGIHVKNLVIHTDEPSIPWHLAYYIPSPPLDFDHLCKVYPCGTILVKDCDDLPTGLKQNSEQPTIAKKKEKEICLIAGELGQKSNGEDLAIAYTARLKDFLKRFGMNVRCVEPADFKAHGRNARQAVRQLDDLFQHAQIVHFTCHVVEGKDSRTGELVEKLKLTEELQIGPGDLDESLRELRSKPLVVLHGCASAGHAGAGSEGARLCRSFLFKGAGGCLATVLPVNLPTDLSRGAESLIEYFYENVFSPQSYGTALHGARQRLQGRSAGRDDPQALFYHLFGDPRETLFASRNVTAADMLAELDDAPPLQCTIRVLGDGLDERRIEEALKGMDGILAVSPRRAAVALGDPVAITTLVFELMVVVPMGMVLEQTLGERLTKLFGRVMRVEGGPERPKKR